MQYPLMIVVSLRSVDISILHECSPAASTKSITLLRCAGEDVHPSCFTAMAKCLPRFWFCPDLSRACRNTHGYDSLAVTSSSISSDRSSCRRGHYESKTSGVSAYDLARAALDRTPVAPMYISKVELLVYLQSSRQAKADAFDGSRKRALIADYTVRESSTQTAPQRPSSRFPSYTAPTLA